MEMEMRIKVDDLTGPDIARLIEEHLNSMTLHSPPESIHALDLDKLKKPGITFWSAWIGDELAGMGAVKELDPEHGEIKSMRTDNKHLKKGVALAILEHIIEESRKRGYRRLSLETGSMEAFLPARKLYEKCGFEYCGPFADYVDDPYSMFMTKSL